MKPSKDQQLKSDIESLLEVNRRMLKKAPANQGNVFVSDQDMRNDIQSLGEEFGCHSHKKGIRRDYNQPFHVDHVPPTNLTQAWINQAWSQRYTTPQHFEFRPHCDGCSLEQAHLVKFLNGSVAGVFPLATVQLDLLLGDINWPGTAIGPVAATASTVPYRKRINESGREHGCHHCMRKDACTYYRTDHYPPQEFLKPYFKKVCLALGIDTEVLDSPVFLPQCAKCSNTQGGKVSSVSARARAYALNNSIVSFAGMQ